MELTEKQKRVAILKEMDQWNKARCAKCHEETEGNSHTAIKCTCKAAVAVRKLGVEYEAGSKLRREGRVLELLSVFQLDESSVDTYDMLKELEVEDRRIMRHLKIRNTQFSEWKFSVGRMKNPPRAETEWEKKARENGINIMTFNTRKRKGWTEEKAATLPVIPRGVAK